MFVKITPISKLSHWELSWQCLCLCSEIIRGTSKGQCPSIQRMGKSTRAFRERERDKESDRERETDRERDTVRDASVS